MKRTSDVRERVRAGVIDALTRELTFGVLRTNRAMAPKFRREDVDVRTGALRRYTCLAVVVPAAGERIESSPTIWFQKSTRAPSVCVGGVEFVDSRVDRLPQLGDVVVGARARGERGLYFRSWIADGAPAFVFLRVLQSGRLSDLDDAERNGVHVSADLRAVARALVGACEFDDLHADVRRRLLSAHGSLPRGVCVSARELLATELALRDA